MSTCSGSTTPSTGSRSAGTGKAIAYARWPTVGKGQRLFEDTPTHKLELADSATLSSGVLNLTYRPGSEPLGTENGPAEPSGASLT